MRMLYIIICCLIIIVILGYKLLQKQKIDKSNLELYKRDLYAAQEKFKQVLKDTSAAEVRLKTAQEATEYEQYKLNECKKDLQAALDTYHDITENKLKEIDELMEETANRRMEALNDTLHETKAKYDLQLKEYAETRQKEADEIRDSCIEAEQQYFEQCKKIREDTEHLQQIYAGIERTLRTYDAEQQEKLFYTIQLPEEYQEDIEFLLTTVAAKVQHPDIISKLVWQEYVKPNLENTFKRIEIKTEPGIYKLTSLQNGKCYVGKSTNVKGRITDHFKSVVGIQSIADQAVHHAIRKEGFWTWMIEIITYCDKEQLSELEKYYIEFFKAQEFGYNKNAGG